MQKLKMNLQKLLTILLSRFKTKNQNEQWVKDRRKFCKPCQWNTLNIEKLSFKQKIIKKLSDFYSLLTNKDDIDTLGNCSACGMCSIYFKTETEVEYCPKNKWERLKN